MNAQELRDKFLNFFEKKGHKKLPSASLIPENDPSALFINSGMHPLVPYLLGEKHPEGQRLASIQKCLRTVDIDCVGDPYHHTFFEMLGNWSLGDYFKKEAIAFSYEFLTQVLNLNPKRLSVTVFKGDKDAPCDEEAALLWQKVGIPANRIFYKGKEENWWQVGSVGPCGPDTEVFYDTDLKKASCCQNCQPGCSCGKYFEIWNDVFMVFNRLPNGTLEPLPQKNVDTGLGLERTLAVLNNLDDNYQTELFKPLVNLIEKISKKSYQDKKYQKAMRIIADHLRASTFILAENISPSNKDQGYVLRRLIRRSLRFAQQVGIKENFIAAIASLIIKNYQLNYPELKVKKDFILQELTTEENRFKKTLERGLKEFNKLIKKGRLHGNEAFNLYQSFGFPLEMTEELLKEKKLSVTALQEEFEKAQKLHEEKSQTSAKGRFKGGLSSLDPKVIKLHTATHLLHTALRQVLGRHARQVGSNITVERLRFDFTHPKPLKPEEIKKTETLVNQCIQKNLKISCETMPLKTAQEGGALAFFGQKYPENVKVYSIKDISKEVCAGPHANFTGELGKFMIRKEESCGAGKRRIYAVLN